MMTDNEAMLQRALAMLVILEWRIYQTYAQIERSRAVLARTR